MVISMAEYLEFISIDPWHLLFTWINLLLLVLLLKKFLFKPVQKVLTQRQAELDKLYSDAEAARTDAEAEKAAYAEKLDGARAEADELLKTAAARANTQSEELLSETQNQIVRMKQRAEADIAQERLKASTEVKDDVSRMVIDIAGKVIGRELNGQDQADLIDKFIDEVGRQ